MLDDTHQVVVLIVRVVASIFLLISSFLLTSHIVFLFRNPELRRNIFTSCMACYCLSLLAEYTANIFTSTIKFGRCWTGALFFYFQFCSDFWALTISYDLRKMTGTMSVLSWQRTWPYFVIYSFVCWLGPIAVLASIGYLCSPLFDHSSIIPFYTGVYCDDSGTVCVVLIKMLIEFIFAAVNFILIIRALYRVLKIRRNSERYAAAGQSSLLRDRMLYMKLFIGMGAVRGLRFIYVVVMVFNLSSYYYILANLIECLEGSIVVIVFMHKRETIFCCRSTSSPSSSATTNNATNTTEMAKLPSANVEP